MPRMALPSSLLWWELGTNLPGPCPGEWLSFWTMQIQVRLDTFIELLTALLLTKSAQQVHVSNKNKNSDDIISRDTVHWTSDGFAYLYQWIYFCRIAGQFTSNLQSRACLTMPSLNVIMFYRNTQGHSGPLIILAHLCRFDPNSYDISSSFRVIWTAFFSFFFFFKERKALLALTIIIFWRYFLLWHMRTSSRAR